MASRLVRSTPDRALRVRAQADDIVLCSWARHLTLTVPLSTQVYKWVPAGSLTKLRGIDLICDDLASRPGEVEMLPAASCYTNRSLSVHHSSFMLFLTKNLHFTVSLETYPLYSFDFSG